ncbi:ABC transporter ATP-binding protein [Ancylobacter terrae]|uniref:ABC transporter ATP-binding protein n=1 Tax=Ancylobacter sp. sgz301288 TaxID=3342077 RepID=UPI00385E02F1
MSAFLDLRGASAFRSVLGFVLRHWRPHRALIAGMVVALLAMTLADVALPIFAGRLVDAVAANAPREAALDAALRAFAAIVALGLLMLVARSLAIFGIVRLTIEVMGTIARDAFARVQRFSADWHANTFSGSTVRKVTRGMWAVDLIHDTLLLALIPSALVLIGSTVMLALRWPLMGLFVGVAALGYVALTIALSLGFVAPAARLSNAWDTRLGGALADTIGANAVVKTFGAEAREDVRLARIVAKWQGRTRRTWQRGTASEGLQTASILVLRAGVIGAALWLWWAGRASPGDVAYVLTMLFVLQGYLREVGHHISNLQRSVNEMEELVALHDAPLGVVDRPGAAPLRITRGRVEFEQVGFHYGNHASPLYDDFSLVIPAGQKVGLVGHSGSGKTTFVKLIQRLHDVTGGRILIDGQDIAQTTQVSLRAQIAIVQQEPILFHRSIAENIGYGRPGASAGEIERAARLANAHDFIARLPRGYGTLVGERGVKLSGGERQRVALARAFLADAPILILDEATSSLDSESEALIQEAMERLIAGRTAIVIAHRLSTVRALDRILVFERGRIIEDGDHDSLVAQPDGTYRRLFERQALGLIDDPS